MDNKVIQGLWIGNNLSVMEQLSLASFIQNGHEYHLYVYEDVGNVPKGVILKDANQMVSREHIFRDRTFGSYATFANLVRWKILLERGGYWADTDLICLRPFVFDSDFVFAYERIDRSRLGINNNVIKAPAGSEIIEFCYHTSLRMMSDSLEWGQIGTKLITKAIDKFNLYAYAYPYKTFNPIDWWDWRDVISGRLIARVKTKLKLTKKVYAVHLWNQMWGEGKVDKDGSYHPKCLYERLKKSYLRQ